MKPCCTYEFTFDKTATCMNLKIADILLIIFFFPSFFFNNYDQINSITVFFLIHPVVTFKSSFAFIPLSLLSLLVSVPC